MTRFGYVMMTCLTLMGVALPSIVTSPLRMVWNLSESVPLGLYRLDLPRDLHVGELVAVMPEKPLAGFMVERGYIGQGVPLLKRIMALPGQNVCRTGGTITVDGIELGKALERDRQGHELPVWQGCRRIADDDIFLMNPSVTDSLDCRYFGPLPLRLVVGRATPIYTDEKGDGRFVWRAVVR